MKRLSIIGRVVLVALLCGFAVLSSSSMAFAKEPHFYSPLGNKIQRKAMAQSIEDCYKYAAKREFKYEEFTSFGDSSGVNYYQYENPDDASSMPAPRVETGSDGISTSYNIYGLPNGEYPATETGAVVATDHYQTVIFNNSSSSSLADFSSGSYGVFSSVSSWGDEFIEDHVKPGWFLTGLVGKNWSSPYQFALAPAGRNGLGNGLARLPQGYAAGLNYAADNSTASMQYIDEGDLAYDTTFTCEDFFSNKEFTDAKGNTAFAGVFSDKSLGAKEEKATTRSDAKSVATFLNRMGYKIDLPGLAGFCARFNFVKEYHDQKSAWTQAGGHIVNFFGGDGSSMIEDTVTKSNYVTNYICVEYETEEPHEISKIYTKSSESSVGYADEAGYEIDGVYGGVSWEVSGNGKGFTVKCNSRDMNSFWGGATSNGCGKEFTEEDLGYNKEGFKNITDMIGRSLINANYKTTSTATDVIFGTLVGSNTTFWIPQEVYYGEDEEANQDPVSDNYNLASGLPISGNFDLSTGNQVDDVNYMSATFKYDDMSPFYAMTYLFGAAGGNANAGTTDENTHVEYTSDGLEPYETALLYRHYLLDYYGAADSTYCITAFQGELQRSNGTTGGDDAVNLFESIEDIQVGANQPSLLKYYVEGKEVSGSTANAKKVLNIDDGQNEHGDYYKMNLLDEKGVYHECYTWPSKNTDYGVFGVDNSGKFFKYVLLDEIIDFLRSWGEGVTPGSTEPAMNVADLAILDTFDSSIVEKRELDCYGSDSTHPGLGIMSLIFCPILEHASKAVQGVYGRVVETFLKIPSDLYGSGSMTEAAWHQFVDVANIMLGVILAIIVFSQVSGWKISVYGVRAMLPRWICWVILTNMSYFICCSIMDICTMLSDTAKELMASIVDGALGTDAARIFAVYGAQEQTSITRSTLILPAIAGVILMAAIIITKGGVLVGILSALFSAVVAFISLFIYLGLRQAFLMVLTAVSPLAFASGIMPNTKNIFQRWKAVFMGLVVVFPICSFLVYAGDAASKLMVLEVQVSATDKNIQFEVIMKLIAAVVCAVAPIFMIPNIVKTAIHGMHQLADIAGGAISGAMSRGAFSGSSAASEGSRLASMGASGVSAAFRSRSVFGRNARLRAISREDKAHMRSAKRNAKYAERSRWMMGKFGSNLGAPLSRANMVDLQRQRAIDAYSAQKLSAASLKYDMLDNRTADQKKAHAEYATKYASKHNGNLPPELSSSPARAYEELVYALGKPDEKHNFYEAMAATQQLQSAEQFAMLNSALREGTAGGLSFETTEQREQFIQTLQQGNGANAPAAMYAKHLESSGSNIGFEEYMATQFGEDLSKGGVEMLLNQDKDALEFIADVMEEGSPASANLATQMEKLSNEQITESFRRMNHKQQKQFNRIVRGMSQARREQIVDALGTNGIADLKLEQVRAINNNVPAAPGSTAAHPSERVIESYLAKTAPGATKSRLEMMRDDPRMISKVNADVRKELGL